VKEASKKARKAKVRRLLSSMLSQSFIFITLFISEPFTDLPPAKLDPDNQKTIPQLQEEAAEAKRKSASSKATAVVTKNGSRKRKRSDETDEGEDSDDISVEFEQNHISNPQAKFSKHQKDADLIPTPMPIGGSIVDLRNKLHDKIATFQKRRGVPDETVVESKDSILEARRLKRAELRENRRKETREKKRAKREGKDKGGNKSGNASKVRLLIQYQWVHRLTCNSGCRHNFWLMSHGVLQ
jgi:hypothetical protein